MATKTKKANPKTTSNRSTNSKTTTIRGNAAKTSATSRTAKQMAKGAAGASKPPKTVARPSGGTKTGGGKPAGGKEGVLNQSRALAARLSLRAAIPSPGVASMADKNPHWIEHAHLNKGVCYGAKPSHAGRPRYLGETRTRGRAFVERERTKS